MTDWSKHVHRFAKKHNMSYKQANRSKKCKETYKKRKTSPRRKMSPRRRRTSPRRKRRMNGPYEDEDMDEFAGRVAEENAKRLIKQDEEERKRNLEDHGKYMTDDELLQEKDDKRVNEYGYTESLDDYAEYWGY